MCVLIAKPAGRTIPEENLRYSNEANCDGIGVSWLADDGTIRMWKNLDSKQIDSAVALISQLKDVQALVHFRRATHGSLSVENVHPFFVDEQHTIAVAHNGILSIRATIPPKIFSVATDEAFRDATFLRESTRLFDTQPLGKTDNLSDTRLFARHVLGNLDHSTRWWRDSEVLSELRRMLQGDRMALLTVVDGIVLLSQGFIEDGGVFYSNRCYRPWTQTPTATSRTEVHKPKNKAGIVKQTDDEQYESWLYNNSRAVSADNTKVLDEFDPFEPLDDGDFLVAYYFRNVEARYAVVCKGCVKSIPTEDEADAIFNSLLTFIPQETCCVCKKDLQEIANVVAEELAILDEVTSEATAPCVVCGKSIQKCECSVYDYTNYDPSDAPLDETGIPDALSESLESLVAISQTVCGISKERIRALCVQIKELGGDPSKLTLLQASEQYPDLFVVFA